MYNALETKYLYDYLNLVSKWTIHLQFKAIIDITVYELFDINLYLYAKKGSLKVPNFCTRQTKIEENVEKKFHVTLNLLEISPSLQRISTLLAQEKNSLAAPTVMENKTTQPRYHWIYNDCKIWLVL